MDSTLRDPLSENLLKIRGIGATLISCLSNKGQICKWSKDLRLRSSFGAHIDREGERIGGRVAVGRRQVQVMLTGRFRSGNFVVGLVSVFIEAEG